MHEYWTCLFAASIQIATLYCVIKDENNRVLLIIDKKYPALSSSERKITSEVPRGECMKRVFWIWHFIGKMYESTFRITSP